ncbi:MAPEG family protein [Rhodoligotrophos defluvii]|uniref:MAPEG family protein n=1 Tax=Rhodoligotrophos defluvii TaxID=2561934 RepID=UPI0010C9E033|nr:MAPEG family protein [Rhodoligotrophos defluvii]
MSTELQLLAWTVVLGLAQLVLATMAARRQDSLEWAMGPRDTPQPPLTGIAGRLARAQANFMETFPFFAAAVLIVAVSARSNALTYWGAQLYFWARLVYLPVYAAGIPYVRSVIWGVSIAGLVLILYAALAG